MWYAAELVCWFQCCHRKRPQSSWLRLLADTCERNLTVLPRRAWCSLARRCDANQTDTTDTEERYALLPLLADTHSVRSGCL